MKVQSTQRVDDIDMELWSRCDDMTLEEAAEWHTLADDVGIEAEPVDIEAVLMGVG